MYDRLYITLVIVMELFIVNLQLKLMSIKDNCDGLVFSKHSIIKQLQQNTIYFDRHYIINNLFVVCFSW